MITKSVIQERYLSIGKNIIFDFLEDIQINKISKILILGHFNEFITQDIQRSCNATVNRLLYHNQAHEEKYDLIISFYDICKILDIQSFIMWINSHLTKDGIFMGCFAGECSIMKTRIKLWAVEEESIGGYTNRLRPMIRLQDLNSILYQFGLKNIISFKESMDVEEKSLYEFLNHIRECGEARLYTAHDNIAPPMTKKLYTAILKNDEVYNDKLEILGFCSSCSTELFATQIKYDIL